MVVKDAELRQGFYHWLEVNEFNAPVMISTIGAEAAYTHGEAWLDQMLQYVEANIKFVDDYLKENVPSVKVVLPQASFLLWLDFRALGLSQPDLMKFLVEKAHIGLNDGSMFGSQGTGFMRLNVGTPRCVLHKALDHIRDAIACLTANN
jgi:cystathionine beta-lyase